MDERDPGEIHQGDNDPSEVVTVKPTVWHPSHSASFNIAPVGAESNPETARACIAAARAALATNAAISKASRQVEPAISWLDLPELHRRMIARNAGLTAEVVVKRDTDLSEEEKARLRAAARDLAASAAKAVRL